MKILHHNTRSGIYRIRNLINGNFYIGSSKDITKRWNDHCRALNIGNNGSLVLQRAWNKYGENNFIFETVEFCNSGVLLEREQHYINKLNPLYNAKMNIVSSTQAVHKNKPELTIRMSLAQYAHRNKNPVSEETKKRLSESHTGIRQTQETKEKIRAAMKDRFFSEETRARIKAAKSGVPVPEERRKRIQETLLRKNRENKVLSGIYRICNKCGEEKDEVFFRKSRTGRATSPCQDCVNRSNRERKAKRL